MLITEIYETYDITPMLQMHQLRAGAVGMFITEHWKGNVKLNKKAVIETLLLHDMGNIIKFDLDNFPELLGKEVERIEFWKQTQKKFTEKYGTDEHYATEEIANEIHATSDVRSILTQLGSANIEKARNGDNYDVKLCFYADLRSGPFGILSINERFDDLIVRYKNRNHAVSNLEKTQANRAYTLEIEHQIQEQVAHPLAAISDKTVSKYIAALKHYEL